MSNVLNTYAPQFKAWSKQLGNKPTAELLETAHCFGRAGKQSLALAMAMRTEGVTAGQIVMACGAPQNNHRRDVIAAGWFKRDMNVPANDAGHTVYQIKLTPKGEAEAKKRREALAATAVDGEAVTKAKPAKVKAKKAAKGKTKVATKAQVAALLERTSKGDNGLKRETAVAGDPPGNTVPHSQPTPVTDEPSNGEGHTPTGQTETSHMNA